MYKNVKQPNFLNFKEKLWLIDECENCKSKVETDSFYCVKCNKFCYEDLLKKSLIDESQFEEAKNVFNNIYFYERGEEKSQLSRCYNYLLRKLKENSALSIVLKKKLELYYTNTISTEFNIDRESNKNNDEDNNKVNTKKPEKKSTLGEKIRSFIYIAIILISITATKIFLKKGGDEKKENTIFNYSNQFDKKENVNEIKPLTHEEIDLNKMNFRIEIKKIYPYFDDNTINEMYTYITKKILEETNNQNVNYEIISAFKKKIINQMANIDLYLSAQDIEKKNDIVLSGMNQLKSQEIELFYDYLEKSQKTPELLTKEEKNKLINLTNKIFSKLDKQQIVELNVIFQKGISAMYEN